MPEVKVCITLKPTLPDAQGCVIQNALAALGYADVSKVRVGKYILMEIDGQERDLTGEVTAMCDRLLANPVIEDYSFEVSP